MGDMNYRLTIDDEDDGQLRHTGMQKKTRTSEVVARQKNFVYPDIVKLAQTEADQFAKCQIEGHYPDYTEPQITFMPTYSVLR